MSANWDSFAWNEIFLKSVTSIMQVAWELASNRQESKQVRTTKIQRSGE
jgi:hypothetical protein